MQDHLITVTGRPVLIKSFAAIIKTDMFDLISLQIGSHLSYEDFIQSKKDEPQEIYGGYTPRELYIQYSNFVKNIFGQYIFTSRLIQDLYSLPKNAIIIFDDWRLKSDINLLAEKFTTSKLTTVYITKDDVLDNSLSSLSNTYENQLTAEECTITHSFNYDWSNSFILQDKIVLNVLT